MSRAEWDPHGIGAYPPEGYTVGMIVTYFPAIGGIPNWREGGVVTKIRSEAWQLASGHWVIKVEGRAGGVSTQHLAPHYGGT